MIDVDVVLVLQPRDRPLTEMGLVVLFDADQRNAEIDALLRWSPARIPRPPE
jgi:hypothetical protein